MQWLFPAIVSSLVGTVVLVFTYLYLYKIEKKKFLLIWGGAWGVYAVRFFFMLLIVSGDFEDYSSLLLILNQLTSLLSGILLLYGSFIFINKPMPRIWLIISAILVPWISGTVLFNVSFLLMSLPTYLFLGTVYIWTGKIFLQRSVVKNGSVTGWAFIIWGLHKANYPFLRPIVWIAPWGYLLGSCLELFVAIGMLLIYFQSARREVTQRKAEFEAIFHAISDAAVFVDLDRKIINVNHAFTEMFGYQLSEIIGQTTKFIYADSNAFKEQGKKRYVKGSQLEKPIYEIEYKCKDGRVFPSETLGAHVRDNNGELIGFLGVMRDITTRKNAEKEKVKINARLQQAYKMEAIGILAGGIAHDFNNILGAIMGYTSMALDDIPEDSEVAKDLDKVLTASYRAKELVKQILAFSRQIDTERIPVCLATIVKEAVKMLRPSLPATIEIIQDISAPDGIISADPTQLQQIVMNLTTNAFHAMESSGGTLSISLREIYISKEDLQKEPSVTPGTFLKLSVCDSGPGIPQEIKDQIFDPYFTTKEVGKGTGMGLSIVHGIVKKYGGFISLYSESGVGSAFHIFIPTTEKGKIENIKPQGQVLTGQESILFIDDEEILAEMGKDMLSRLGYNVTTSSSSLDALELFEKQPEKFDLVITDQTMPGMTGADLARRMLQIRPSIPIILCTGFSSIISEEKAKVMGIKEFAFKPLVKNDISQLIRKALDDRENRYDNAAKC